MGLTGKGTEPKTSRRKETTGISNVHTQIFVWPSTLQAQGRPLQNQATEAAMRHRTNTCQQLHIKGDRVCDLNPGKLNTSQIKNPQKHT